MRKGVILEINDLYLTLLTPEGEFLRARKLQQDYQLGEEIHFFPEMAEVKRKKINLSFLNSFKARTTAFTAAFLLVLTAFLPLYQSSQVYAYMSIDVNPSVELAVNQELKVLRIKGYNQAGEEIVEGIKGWKKRDAAVVAEMILNEMEQEGFLKSRQDVVIATVHRGKVKEKVEKQLEKKITEIKKTTQEEKLELKVINGTTEDREEAQELGVTTGVYIAKMEKKAKPAVQNQKPVVQNSNQDKKASINTGTKPGKQESPGQEKKLIPNLKKAETVMPAVPKEEKSNDIPNDKSQGSTGKNEVKKQSKNFNEKKENRNVNKLHHNNAQRIQDERKLRKMKQIRQDNIGHIGNSKRNKDKK